MSAIEIKGYVPGTLGRVVELHGRYYHRHWGLTQAFEAEVARELAEFLTRFDPARDGIWTAVQGEAILGSITIDGSAAAATGAEARLRWFIVDEACQGQGVGRRLMGEAIGFCRRAELERVYLWTLAGLDSARHLYDAWGFQPTESFQDTDWGPPVEHQRLALTLPPQANR